MVRRQLGLFGCNMLRWEALRLEVCEEVIELLAVLLREQVAEKESREKEEVTHA